MTIAFEAPAGGRATEVPGLAADDESDQHDLSPFAQTIYESKYAMVREDGSREAWPETAERVVSNVLGAVGYGPDDVEYRETLRLVKQRKFLPGGRYLYASGRGLHQTQNCLLLRAEDSREGWAEVMRKAGMALMTGAGIGVDYSLLRPAGTPIKKTGGEASGPVALMKIVNEIGRNVMQGGSRRSAIWAGLAWHHGDALAFARIKDWDEETRDRKTRDFNYPAPMDMTNVSILLDDDFFEAIAEPYWRKEYVTPWGCYERTHEDAKQVYWKTVEKMVKTGEPGFSVDVGENAGETLRNACTEVTSADDNDICNLGSINLARIEDEAEMARAVQYGTLFLLAGTVYSHLPYAEVHDTRAKNRRLGLGVMGVHEWLLARDKQYAPDEELGRWMEIYQRSGKWAARWARVHGLSAPVKTRAIAPTGTIGIVAETTTGIEPVFCVAYKRRYKTAAHDGQDKIQYQYVIDPTAKRLIERGVDPDRIEDAYMLSLDVERRLEMQAWAQQYVDHGISSTINLPYPIEAWPEAVDFGETLLRYLPRLRGVTVYPNGARGGQPLTPVPYRVAAGSEGVVFEETEERCVGGVCGA
jgi:ribonucleoside-diphosphate reductase alpha chain